ncbi:hypothetical protein CC80DRAFT_595705 [Byssothecium circinans]|uniref:Uncharacterized protein n=1 Tax=Byssothecium circinans TaxID=147558 RepID=A0A6A5TRT1_9PLEO|nr:hypothetical protein CC80DRAFT_595705 [Byssothecium circinans]
MAPGPARPNYDGPCARRQPCSARSRRDSRRADCLPIDGSASSANRRASIAHREFAPSWNRFSILADLDSSATQTEWSFDFKQTSRSARRRSQRGNHNWLKQAVQQRRASQKDAVPTHIANRAVPDESPKTPTPGLTLNHSGEPLADFPFTLNPVRHHWRTQFRPNSETFSTGSALHVPETFALRPPEPCLTEAKGKHCRIASPSVKPKPSNLAPLSVPVAIPSVAVSRGSPAQGANVCIPWQRQAGKQPPRAPSTPTQKAVAAACRAVTAQLPDSVPSSSPSSRHPSVASSPSPLRSLLQAPLTPERSSPVNSPYSLLSITPPSTATPVLSTYPTVSDLTTSPSIFATLPPPQPNRIPSPLPSQLLSAHIVREAWTEPKITILDKLFQNSLITAPAMSQRPFINHPKMTSYFSTSGPIKPAVPRFLTPRVLATLSKVPQEDGVEAFLKKGHAKPCWCAYYKRMHPSTTSQTLDDTHEAAVSTPGLSSALGSPITIIRKRKYSDTDLEAELENLTISPSTASAKSDSDFEDPSYSVRSFITASATEADERSQSPQSSEKSGSMVLLPETNSEQASPEEDDDWSVVTPDDDRYGQRNVAAPSTNLITPTSTDTDAEFLAVSPSASVISYPTPPRTPLLSPRIPSPPLSQTLRTTLTQAFNIHPPNPPPHPSTPTTIIAPAPSNVEILYGLCPDCMNNDCECTSAATSGAEWPTP